MRASDTPVAVHVLRATIRFVEDDEGKKQVVPPNKAHGTCGAQVCIMILFGFVLPVSRQLGNSLVTY